MMDGWREGEREGKREEKGKKIDPSNCFGYALPET